MRAVAVLVVDDEPGVREGLRAFFEDEGFAVTLADSGEAALALVQEGARFDVCVMDIRLPEMDGNDAIRALHAASGGEIAFLIHTGSAEYALPEDLAALGLSGADIFWKPLTDMTPLAEAVLAASRRGAE